MDENYQPGPVGDPQRIFTEGRWSLILTRELGHPVNRVWAALTEPGQLSQWAPFRPDRNLASTGDVLLTMPDGGDGSEDLQTPGTVLESDPPRLLVFRWGDDLLRWELNPTEDGTTLVLRHSFDDEGMTSALAAGWHICLDVADALMKGVPFGPVVGKRARDYGWDELNQRYAKILDVQASQL
jgi:uncharacterized protein YndB with AHSA1/START domain